MLPEQQGRRTAKDQRTEQAETVSTKPASRYRKWQPFDEILKKRSQEIKAKRESLLLELNSLRRNVALPVDRILPGNIEALSKAN